MTPPRNLDDIPRIPARRDTMGLTPEQITDGASHLRGATALRELAAALLSHEPAGFEDEDDALT